MPKLYGIEEKFINGIRVDKENNTVFYEDSTHSYYDKEDMGKYISVTSLVGLYSQSFNENFWSAYKSLEALLPIDTWMGLKSKLLATKSFSIDKFDTLNLPITIEQFIEKQNEIKAQYEQTRKEACEYGTAKHLEMEEKWYNTKKFDFKKFGFGEVTGDFVCKKGYYNLDLKNGVYPEILLSVKSRDGILRVSGTCDLLVIDENDVYLVDYKTSKEINKKGFYDSKTKKQETMKFPLNKLPESNFYHYSCQLSLYAYMLQQINPNYNIKKLIIYHMPKDGKESLIECPYLKDEIERMLKHYKKQLKIQSELDKDKPIIS